MEVRCLGAGHAAEQRTYGERSNNYGNRLEAHPQGQWRIGNLRALWPSKASTVLSTVSHYGGHVHPVAYYHDCGYVACIDIYVLPSGTQRGERNGEPLWQSIYSIQETGAHVLTATGLGVTESCGVKS